MVESSGGAAVLSGGSDFQVIVFVCCEYFVSSRLDLDQNLEPSRRMCDNSWTSSRTDLWIA